MNTSSKSDAELIEAVINGQQNDFGILVERYQKKIFSYLFRFLYENRDAAEDVTQNEKGCSKFLI